MKGTTRKIYDELFERYPILNGVKNDVLGAFDLMETCCRERGMLFCAGNGGSSSDCEHIVGELLKSFKKHRDIDEKTKDRLLSYGTEGKYLVDRLEGALPAMSLMSQTGILTAFSNDRTWDSAIAQQLYGLGKRGDCLLVLSTSGNSKNCVNAVLVAKAKEIKTIAFTGMSGGKLKDICDECICVPESETYKVQELHLPVYHCLCAMLEEEIF